MEMKFLVDADKGRREVKELTEERNSGEKLQDLGHLRNLKPSKIFSL